MEKEFIKDMEKSVTLNVTAGKIDSFRQIEKTRGTVRVYEDGFVGVAGCLGEPDESGLTEKAIKALSFRIPYPEKLEGALEKEEIHEAEIIPISEFVPRMQAFLDKLGERCPNFAFSNKIRLTHKRREYRNSKGRRLVSGEKRFSLELIVQSRGSGNTFDTGLGWQGNHFDEEALLTQFGKEYDAFYQPAELPAGHLPVVMDPIYLLGRTLQHFVGDMYAAGASLLSGKLGEQVFSDKLTVKDDLHPATAGACFFDAEGCVTEDYRPALVEKGVLKGLLTNKKTAEQYGLPNLGTADAAYDGVPDLGFHGLYLDPTAKSLKELVPGPAVYVVLSEGGNATPEGHFAAPVQMAYLLEDGELKGRLPQISISGDFFDMLGKDYLGTVRDEPLEGGSLSAFMMQVELI